MNFLLSVFLITFLVAASQAKLIFHNTWIANDQLKQHKQSNNAKQKMLGAQLPLYAEKPKTLQMEWAHLFSRNGIQQNFDARRVWSNCSFLIKNQGQCGSCWSFAAGGALSDRFCTEYQMNVDLSQEFILDCDTEDFDCEGGQLNSVENFLVSIGTVLESCQPYAQTAGQNSQQIECARECTNKTEINKNRFYGNNMTKLTADQAKQELIQYGTVITAFTVMDDFMAYQSGVYIHASNKAIGGHAVRVVGFGIDEDSGTPYWIAANSWGTEWGELGFFRYAMGQGDFDTNFYSLHAFLTPSQYIDLKVKQNNDL